MATMFCIALKVVFLSNLFPKYTPKNADNVASKTNLKSKATSVLTIFGIYMLNREISTKHAITTPVTMKDSFDKPERTKKTLLSAP
ncbi:hypothetical protein GCM10023230_26880 [Flavobacterium hankyongi]|uniref:Uncharacterized protein n=1 Tax=Flavobacterium hankyongi TaxID=1176532 RepID=A0ABP9A6J0_9FLAO